MHVFVSRPSSVGAEFDPPFRAFEADLQSKGFVLRRLGGENYSKKAPLRAVIDLIAECSGAIVLGYPQVVFTHEARRSTAVESEFRSVLPTPWNQIEGAIAYSLGTPILVVAHPGIAGGVFDHGITGEGVLHIDLAEPDWFRHARFAQPFAEWYTEVEACERGRAGGG